MPARVGRAVLRGLTVPAARHPPDPRAVFILSLCVVSGFPLIFAGATPGTIAAQLDKPFVVAWGIMLSAGALLTLVGALRQTVNGIILEQVGSVSLGFACLMYAGAIWLQVRWEGSVPAGIVLGLGLACLWRWAQLQAHMIQAQRIANQLPPSDPADDA